MKLLTDVKILEAAGTPVPGWDPNRPWNSVFKALLKDEQFWQHEYCRHALMIVARIRSATNHVDGDAPVGGPTSANLAQVPTIPNKKIPPTNTLPPPPAQEV